MKLETAGWLLACTRRTPELETRQADNISPTLEMGKCCRCSKDNALQMSKTTFILLSVRKKCMYEFNPPDSASGRLRRHQIRYWAASQNFTGEISGGVDLRVNQQPVQVARLVPQPPTRLRGVEGIRRSPLLR